MRFASFLSGGFTTMKVMNPPEKKLEKCTSVHCSSTMTITHLYKTPYHTKPERTETAYVDLMVEKRARCLGPA